MDRDRYIKNLTCTQVSSEALSHAVHKRTTDIDPQQRHLQTTNNVNEQDYRGFSQGMFNGHEFLLQQLVTWADWIWTWFQVCDTFCQSRAKQIMVSQVSVLTSCNSRLRSLVSTAGGSVANMAMWVLKSYCLKDDMSKSAANHGIGFHLEKTLSRSKLIW